MVKLESDAELKETVEGSEPQADPDSTAPADTGILFHSISCTKQTSVSDVRPPESWMVAVITPLAV